MKKKNNYDVWLIQDENEHCIIIYLFVFSLSIDYKLDINVILKMYWYKEMSEKSFVQ